MNGVGRNAIFSNKEQKIMADNIALQDRSNNRLAPAAVIKQL